MSKKDTYINVKVTLDGCDDSTVAELEVTQEQYEFLKNVEDIVNEKSTYSCEPTMSVEHKAVNIKES